MRQPSLPTKQNYLAPNNNRAEIENPQPGVDSGLEATGNAVPQLLVGVVVGAWGGGGAAPDCCQVKSGYGAPVFGVRSICTLISSAPPGSEPGTFILSGGNFHVEH